MTSYQALDANLRKLNLLCFAEHLPVLLDEQDKAPKSLTDALYALTQAELAYREQKQSVTRIRLAWFPYEKQLDDFDFSYQPTLERAVIEDLASLRFLNDKENILFVGTSGVGKTHLATSIGMEACKQGFSTLFIRCGDLVERLRIAHDQQRGEAALRRYARYQVLIIDEIGYLPIDSIGAKMFFQLIERRYERKSTIITTNIALSKWGDTFADKTLANAILDRLVHHSRVIRINGRSYRMKGHITEPKADKAPNDTG